MTPSRWAAAVRIAWAVRTHLGRSAVIRSNWARSVNSSISALLAGQRVQAEAVLEVLPAHAVRVEHLRAPGVRAESEHAVVDVEGDRVLVTDEIRAMAGPLESGAGEIGRASCREGAGVEEVGGVTEVD